MLREIHYNKSLWSRNHKSASKILSKLFKNYVLWLLKYFLWNGKLPVDTAKMRNWKGMIRQKS